MSYINNAPTICFVYSKALWRKIGTKTGSTFKTGAVRLLVGHSQVQEVKKIWKYVKKKKVFYAVIFILNKFLQHFYDLTQFEQVFFVSKLCIL